MWSDPDDASNEQHCWIEKDVLFDQAIRWFLERDMISIIADDFGPPMYQTTDQFDAQ